MTGIEPTQAALIAPFAHPFHPYPEPMHPGNEGRCTTCHLTEPEHEGLMTEVEALRASAKAHIVRKHAEAKERVRAQGRTMPAFTWSDPVTWLDDWQPDV